MSKKTLEKLSHCKNEEEFRSELIWEVEMKLSSKCFIENNKRIAKDLPDICNCPLPETLTNEELLAILAEGESDET